MGSHGRYSSSESLESWVCPAEFHSSGLSRGGVILPDNILEGNLIEHAHCSTW